MLKSLHVKNIALIDDTNVEFFDGFNIISGETGAGKSLLIKSVELALGKKGDKSLIRKGEEYALVELEFDFVPDVVKKILEDECIEINDEIIISRKISDKKSVARINGENVNLKLLNKVVSHLIALHGQESSVEFRNEDYHLEILDMYAGSDIEKLKCEMQICYNDLLKKKEEFYKLKTKANSPEFSRDFLEFEVGELEEANLVLGEDEELEKRYKIISESKSLIENVNMAYIALSDSGGISETIGNITSALAPYENLDDDIKEIYGNLSSIEAISYDVTRLLDRYIDNFSYDEEEKVRIENRLNDINRLTNKYNLDEGGLIKLLEEKKKTLFELDNFDDILKKAEDEYNLSLKKYYELAKDLSNKRKALGEKFVKDTIKELKDLEFSKIEMKLDFKERSEPHINGIDEVSILVSFNAGEDIKPLTEIASGGELSRVMLAVKSALGTKEEIPTMIFDEIDSGISGNAALRVGKKMKEISRNRQLLCITHLAQIVALGDNNYLIEKSENANVTTTNVKKLDENETIFEIGRILGGSNISESVIETAKELRKTS